MKKQSKRIKQEKEEYHHGDLRNVLIQTAKKILTEEGVDHLTLRYCTQQAGVSPSALSHHFKNLEGLLTSVAASGFYDLAEAMKKNLNSIRKNQDPVKSILKTYINFALVNSDLYRAMFSPKVGLGATDYIQANQECFLILKDEVEKQKNKFNGLTAEIAAFRIWALAHGFLLMVLTDRVQMVLPEKESKNENIDKLFFDSLLKGVW